MKKTTNHFCLHMLEMGIGHARALANLVMALASHRATSVVALSESDLFHYQYSSITDAISHLAEDASSLERIEGQIRRQCLQEYWPGVEDDEPLILQSDKTPCCKKHSPCLPDRFVIPVPNCLAPGQRGLDIGYEYSFVNLCAQRGRWSLPLSARCVPLDKKPGQVVAEQVRAVLRQEDSPLAIQPLVINTLDSGYAVACYLDGVKDIEHLVSITRLRWASKVYLPALPEEQIAGKVTKVFGRCFYLLTHSAWRVYKRHPKTGQSYEVFEQAITESPPAEEVRLEEQLKNGRRVLIHLRQWSQLLMRTKDGISMADKPFSLTLVEVYDAQTRQRLFPRPLFLAAFGPKQGQLRARQIYAAYRRRSGIEHFFHFAKEKLLLDRFQTPDAQHLHNWMLVVTLAMWLLYTARGEVTNCPKKWQRYLPSERHIDPTCLSPAQVHKAMQPYLLTFDQAPFLPLKSKPGPGRQRGQTQTPRQTFAYRKKQTKKPKQTQNTS